MHETADDLAYLQRLLDESYAAAGEHLRSIDLFSRRRSSAEDVVAGLRGVFLINLATVTDRSEPIVAPVDGLFYRGRLWFSLPPGSQRARHLRARPQASATYVEGDEAPCLIVHGLAQRTHESHPFFDGFDHFARDVYGIAVDVVKDQLRDRTGPDFTGFIEPRRIFAGGFRQIGT
jgi:hypothetical protein